MDMSIVINTNVQSLFAQNALSKNTSNLQKSIERLSTGYRINRAADDAAGLTIAQGHTSKLRGLQQVERNIGDGISLLQTAEGAVSIVQENLQRIRELVVQSASGTNSSDELDAIQREINSLVTTIDDIGTDTTFNGVAIIKSASNVTLQTGADDGQTTSIVLAGGTAAGIHIDSSVTTAGSIGEGAAFNLDDLHVGGTVNSNGGTTTITTSPLTGIDIMIDNVARMTSYLGAVENGLESKLDYTSDAIVNASDALSRVMDVDVAAESSLLVRNQILQQTSATMLAQANNMPSLALTLLP
ncbi:MAG: flagellin [Cyanobacteria bacterium]|nr:flagellin [Cyanobacteriota bacterium]MDA1020123.1 flagellin [Cyanobacteriota bacterium]